MLVETEETSDETLYEILGVEEEATLDDIIRAYRQRALEEHPDKGGDKDRFDELNKAYNVLSDQQKRERYDEKLLKEREREELVEGGRGGYSKQQLQAPMRVKTAPTPGSKRQAQMRTAQPGKPGHCASEWKGLGSGKGLLKMLTDDVTAEEKTQKLLEQYTALPRCREKRQEWASGLRGKEKFDLKAAAKKKEQQERAKWSAWLSNGVVAARGDAGAKAKAKGKAKAKPKPKDKPEAAAEPVISQEEVPENVQLPSPDVAQTG
eukprot:Skav209452  [mRNA]  locus=scaffold2695:73810:89392:+ [translate_table: standard]